MIFTDHEPLQMCIIYNNNYYNKVQNPRISLFLENTFIKLRYPIVIHYKDDNVTDK